MRKAVLRIFSKTAFFVFYVISTKEKSPQVAPQSFSNLCRILSRRFLLRRNDKLYGELYEIISLNQQNLREKNLAS
ncbi:hypothetical protein ASE21_19540 [Flavobacterium sp. Root901]|nr:hypothetical protein ASE21_19540 [Flavobacterium sp. Root901]